MHYAAKRRSQLIIMHVIKGATQLSAGQVGNTKQNDIVDGVWCCSKYIHLTRNHIQSFWANVVICENFILFSFEIQIYCRFDKSAPKKNWFQFSMKLVAGMVNYSS